MAVSPQIQAFADRLDAASNEIAKDLKDLRDKIAAGTPLTPEDNALLESNIARLEALGTDPANPVPPTF